MDNEPDVFNELSKAGRIGKMDGRLVVDAGRYKRAKLSDILRRLIANPENVAEVAEEIAADWYPMVQVNSRGCFEIVVGSGKKR